MKVALAEVNYENPSNVGLEGYFDEQTNEDWQEGIRPELLWSALRDSRGIADHAQARERALVDIISGIAFSPSAVKAKQIVNPVGNIVIGSLPQPGETNGYSNA